jgi:hypothetical protein
MWKVIFSFLFTTELHSLGELHDMSGPENVGSIAEPPISRGHVLEICSMSCPDVLEIESMSCPDLLTSVQRLAGLPFSGTVARLCYSKSCHLWTHFIILLRYGTDFRSRDVPDQEMKITGLLAVTAVELVGCELRDCCVWHHQHPCKSVRCRTTAAAEYLRRTECFVCRHLIANTTHTAANKPQHRAVRKGKARQHKHPRMQGRCPPHRAAC